MAKKPTSAPLSPEQQQEADRYTALFLRIAQQEARRFGELMAARPDEQLLGRTEFDLRDLVLQRVGAPFLAAVLDERKKGGTEGRASSARTANPTPG
jgi:hypothetical protein